jgi:hypothetical protein
MSAVSVNRLHSHVHMAHKGLIYMGLHGIWSSFLKPFLRLVIRGLGIAVIGCLCISGALLANIGVRSIVSHVQSIRVLSTQQAAPHLVILQTQPTMEVAPWDQSVEQNHLLLDTAQKRLYSPSR